MSLYDCLSVSKDASVGELEQAYQRALDGLPKSGVRGWLIRSLGLDSRIHYAFFVLSNPRRRRDYDRDLRVNSHMSHMYLGY
ncbi:hypothetical protein [Pseudaminobacter sp. NGMCC 1.201702]|uniref:hypothetical protein n=1 Tax=Pseudaminobacter sp. NGMCC 1.201702 TaxID=3391825 RepID=UPI0039F077BD